MVTDEVTDEVSTTSAVDVTDTVDGTATTVVVDGTATMETPEDTNFGTGGGDVVINSAISFLSILLITLISLLI